LESIAHDFFVEVSSITGSSIDSPYKQHAIVAEPAKENSSSSNANKHNQLDMTEMTADGRVANLSKVLLAAGFVVGSHVKRADGVIAKLAGVDDDRVRLMLDDSLSSSMEITAFLKENWVMYQPKTGPEVVCASKLIVMDNLEYSAHVMKARIMLELDGLTQKHQKCNDFLKVFNKPKSVQVDTGVAKGNLVLVPTTTRISHKLGDLGSRTSDNLYVGDIMGNVQFWLMAHSGGENSFVAAFWNVQFVTEADKANMEVHHIKTSIDKLTIPVLKNLVKLSPGDTLYVFKKVDKKQRFTELKSEAQGSGHSAAEPKKKLKRV
jgi:hypothetical protein